MAFISYTINNLSYSNNGSSVNSPSAHTGFTPFFLQARAIRHLVLQLRQVAFLNLHVDCKWPLFPHEKEMYEFDWEGEGEFRRTPWPKKGGTREFPPADGETAEFL